MAIFLIAFLSNIALTDACSQILSFHRKIVLNGGTQAPYPYGLAVFENHVFFTDWTKMGVVRANRFNGSNPTLLYRTAKRPGHVVISHRVMQPVGKGAQRYSAVFAENKSIAWPLSNIASIFLQKLNLQCRSRTVNVSF